MTLAITFLSCWFLAAFTLSISGWFERFSSASLFGVGALATATAFTVLQGFAESFRCFACARSLKAMSYVQLLRLYGTFAFFKAYEHVLPALFAIPTAVQDIVFAVSALYVARGLVTADGRALPGFVAWHIAGLAGLGMSVVLAILTSTPMFGLIHNGITSQPMARFPMSLVPTFVGPTVLTFHLLAVASARHSPKSGLPPPPSAIVM